MAPNPNPIRLLLADDQSLFRHGLQSVIEDWPDIHIVGAAADGVEAVAMARRFRPDVVLMDINMPNMNGLDATRQLRAELPETRVVILTVSEQDESVFEAIKIGARGYLLKDIKPVVLHEMILAVVRGEAPISPVIAARILSEFTSHMPLVPGPRVTKLLTDREKEVLELVATGADNRTIAERLYLAPGTVKRHLHNILEKLQARSREEAAAFALRQGIISPETPE